MYAFFLHVIKYARFHEEMFGHDYQTYLAEVEGYYLRWSEHKDKYFRILAGKMSSPDSLPHVLIDFKTRILSNILWLRTQYFNLIIKVTGQTNVLFLYDTKIMITDENLLFTSAA